MKISYPEISTDINILITDLLDNRLLWNGKKIKLESVIIRNSCALTSTNICHTHAYEHQCTYSVSPKGWYHGAPPPFSLAPPSFNFKVYAEKYCFITLIEHCVFDIIEYFNYVLLYYRYHMLEVKIGRRIYPHYDVIINKPLFTSREDFDRFVCVCVCLCNNTLYIYNISVKTGPKFPEAFSPNIDI